MNPVSKMLGCRYPVIQGAMSVISNPELVAAVSEGGGFGLIATAFMGKDDTDLLRNQIKAVKKITNKPFGANLQMMNPLSRQYADILAEEDIACVTVSGGSPKDLLPHLKALGMKVIAVVPSVEAASKSEALGVDAIVAEGTESGGIQGVRGASTMVLVPAVVDAVKIPVIAAGGIGDSRGYKAAFALGAKGVQVGTRFIATRECIANERWKSLILETNETGTAVMNMGRYRSRIITSTSEGKIDDQPVASAKPHLGTGFSASQKATESQEGTLSAGEVCGLIHSIKSVQEVIDEMVA